MSARPRGPEIPPGFHQRRGGAKTPGDVRWASPWFRSRCRAETSPRTGSRGLMSGCATMPPNAGCPVGVGVCGGHTRRGRSPLDLLLPRTCKKHEKTVIWGVGWRGRNVPAAGCRPPASVTETPPGQAKKPMGMGDHHTRAAASQTACPCGGRLPQIAELAGFPPLGLRLRHSPLPPGKRGVSLPPKRPHHFAPSASSTGNRTTAYGSAARPRQQVQAGRPDSAAGGRARLRTSRIGRSDGSRS